MASYVEARDDNLYVGKSRVTPQTLVEAWRSGVPQNSFKPASQVCRLSLFTVR